ncbi:acetyl-CoA acetyltransferase [Nonomuraea aridisoli]|uniref:acetyl-CoA acetyltransferase n=1 Tax=Nonomuraea aridisoli TaxID=2070368 RepID=UPI001EFF012E|nr:acetyl-CoA acetyltransferase [Nonomuraea aridisoli]
MVGLKRFEGVDPRTPVLVGAGQASERIDEPGYQRLSAVELGAAAAREALADTGADPAEVAAAVDTVAGVRQFEISTPGARAPLGRSANYPRSVARRIGAAPRRAILEVVGGQSPQHLVNELAATIAAGGARAALIVGSEAISTAQHLAGAADRPDFTENVDGDLEDRGYGLAGLVSRALIAHGLTDAPTQYALFDNARRARLGQSREEYAAGMGALFAPFTKIAAANPHAAAPVERTAEELVTPSERNRPIADPYTRYLVAREKVNQGAAVLLTSVEEAERLGVPRDRWVFLHGHADLRERDLLERADLSRGPASVMAARHALELAGIGAGDLAAIDLYSCFPIAVSHVCEGLGLPMDGSRELTVTGGLPFFGGPGNAYSLHAIAEIVRRMRAQPGAYGLVGANGGMLSKYSAGVYSTTPAPWLPGRSATLQAEIDSWPAVGQVAHPDGWATIETYTVKHGRDGRRTGIVVGRLKADGRRFLAMTADGDDAVLDLLTTGEPIGRRVYVRSFGFGNRVTLGDARMDELFPPRPAGLRDDYAHVHVRRDGHVLEVAVDRLEAAHDELDQVFDAFFADPDLWVAILTGTPTDPLPTNDDLSNRPEPKPSPSDRVEPESGLSGRPSAKSVVSPPPPKTGLAGLTARRGMAKPVIAAVNGPVLGAAFEVVLACHLVVADETAVFALDQMRAGQVATGGGLVRLARALPAKLATELVLTGRHLTAAEAHRHGLVNRVTQPGGALEGARALAQDLLAVAPPAVRASLRILSETAAIPDPIDAITHPSPALDEALFTEDAAEGWRAMTENRPPHWHNR